MCKYRLSFDTNSHVASDSPVRIAMAAFVCHWYISTRGRISGYLKRRRRPTGKLWSFNASKSAAGPVRRAAIRQEVAINRAATAWREVTWHRARQTGRRIEDGTRRPPVIRRECGSRWQKPQSVWSHLGSRPQHPSSLVSTGQEQPGDRATGWVVWAGASAGGGDRLRQLSAWLPDALAKVLSRQHRHPCPASRLSSLKLIDNADQI